MTSNPVVGRIEISRQSVITYEVPFRRVIDDDFRSGQLCLRQRRAGLLFRNYREASALQERRSLGNQSEASDRSFWRWSYSDLKATTWFCFGFHFSLLFIYHICKNVTNRGEISVLACSDVSINRRKSSKKKQNQQTEKSKICFRLIGFAMRRIWGKNLIW